MPSAPLGRVRPSPKNRESRQQPEVADQRPGPDGRLGGQKAAGGASEVLGWGAVTPGTVEETAPVVLIDTPALQHLCDARQAAGRPVRGPVVIMSRIVRFTTQRSRPLGIKLRSPFCLRQPARPSVCGTSLWVGLPRAISCPGGQAEGVMRWRSGWTGSRGPPSTGGGGRRQGCPRTPRVVFIARLMDMRIIATPSSSMTARSAARPGAFCGMENRVVSGGDELAA
jgi:hypothetical protein